MSSIDMLESWLESLPKDIETFVDIASNGELPVEVRKQSAGVLNYLFKSVDLIPDGIDDIGFLDDVLTLRIGASLLDHGEIARENTGAAERVRALDGDMPAIRELLGEDIFRRFQNYTLALREGSARGRSTSDIVSSESTLHEVRMDVRNFASQYAPPRLDKSERTLKKLKSFLDTRLPR
jgi:uncharacterized membrane protein YkvA (DUF1232 family)